MLLSTVRSDFIIQILKTIKRKQITSEMKFDIEDSSFTNIWMMDSAKGSIISDEIYSSKITITNTEFDIGNGGILYSDHQALSIINIENITVITDQVNVNNEDTLFFFSSSDDTTINNMRVIYKYNTTTACSVASRITHSVLDAGCDVLHCKNMVFLMQNEGQVFHSENVH